MISKLTKAQEELVPVYLNKWLKHGLRTDTVDKEKAREAIDFMYVDLMQIEKPKYVFFLDSPMAVQLAINLFKNKKFDVSKSSQLRSQLGSQLVRPVVD